MGERLKRREFVFVIMMIGPAILMLLALNVYPLLTAFQSSFNRVHPVTREMSWVGVRYYFETFQDIEFWEAAWRSFVWTFGGVAVQLVLGIALALLLHTELKGRNIARGMVLFPYVVPAVVAAATFRFMLNPLTGIIGYIQYNILGLGDTPLNWFGDPQLAMIAAIAVGAWKFVPFMIILFLARLQTAPLELYDAAKIDGANWWGEFRHITIPWLRPTIIVAVLLRTMWLFKDFETIYLLAEGGPLRATRTLPIHIYITAFERRHMGEAAAISILTLVLFLPLAILYLRWYQKSEEQITL